MIASTEIIALVSSPSRRDTTRAERFQCDDKRIFMRIVALITLALCLACAPDTPSSVDTASPVDTPSSVAQDFSPAKTVTASRLSMGSTLTLTAWTGDEPAAKRAFDEVFAEFTRLETLMSTWIAESDVSRVNREAGVRPVAVSADVRDVLNTARQMSEWTNGKFDVTFGALSGLWKFDHDQDGVIPDMREVRRRLPLIDYRAIQIDDAAGTVFLARKGMSMHLGGIGKGYAVDRAAAILRLRGVRDFMVQSGGDIYVGGMKDRRPWRLGIQDPRGTTGRSFAELDLSDGTFSTSGDYERTFVKNGRRYHHILDPATGEPARGTRSVTIVSNRAVLADGLSTGVFILGPAAGMALIERLPDIEGVIVSEKNEVLISSGLKNKLTIVAPPTDAP
jgi:thiamine biosynthesis lipoprotein